MLTSGNGISHTVVVVPDAEGHMTKELITRVQCSVS